MTRLLLFISGIGLFIQVVHATEPLVLPDVSGVSQDLQTDFGEGKSVVLVFWAPWCGSCAKEAPEMVKAYKMYTEKASFYGVVTGTDKLVNEKKVQKFITRYEVNYPTLRDREAVWAKRFQVRGTPTIIVLNSEGSEVFRGHHPPAKWQDVL